MCVYQTLDANWTWVAVLPQLTIKPGNTVDAIDWTALLVKLKIRILRRHIWNPQNKKLQFLVICVS